MIGDETRPTEIGVSPACMHRSRKIVVPVLRVGAMVALAMLLILGLLPAILAAQTGRS